MQFEGAVAVVTGGGSGIGRGLCERLAALGAAHVVAADINLDAAEAAAAAINETAGPSDTASTASAVSCDVTDDASVRRAVDSVIEQTGRIDLFCANAGIGSGAGLDADDAMWEASWQINVMGVVRCARAVVPHMESSGGGSFLVTASSVGLTTGPVSFNYATSKHAAIGVAEWLAINHGPTIKVSALCPTVVDTPMMADFGKVMVEPLTVDDVVHAAVAGLAEDRFLITPHPPSLDMFQAKANDWDGFLANMQQRLAALRASQQEA